MEIRIMNLGALFLSGVLVSGLTLTFVPPVAADPPPWAGAWGHSTRADRDYDKPDRYYWRHRNGDPQYSKLVERINNDRAKIAEIAPTGRHRKALRWYRDDLRNAERDMRNYRDHRTRSDLDSSGRYYGSSYDSDSDGSFDWSNLLGALLNPTQ